MGLLRTATIVVTATVFIGVLNLFFMFGPPATSDGTQSSLALFEPSWEIQEGIKAYMGNLTCPFEVAHWNLESFFRPIHLERRRDCAKLRYVPYEGYVAPDASEIFDKLANGTTIYLIGDSMMCQAGVDFLCLMASVSEVTQKEIGRLPPKNWCTGANECEVDFAGFTGWMSANATFRSKEPDNRKDINVVVSIEHGRVGDLRKHLINAKEGDIYVMNQGLHTRADRGRDFLLNSFTESRNVLVSAINKGAKLFWKETTAAHFSTDDGYYDPSALSGHPAICVPSSVLDRNKSQGWDNKGIGSLMQSLNVTVIEAWEASFLAPEWCHVGQGKDCVHWLQPGPTSYQSEALLDHILNDL